MLALGTAQAHLMARGFVTDHNILSDLQPSSRRQDASQQRRLVVTSLCQTAGVERHGHHQIGCELALLPICGHGRAERPRQVAAVVVLEIMDGVAQGMGKDRAGGDPIQVGGGGTAGGAQALDFRRVAAARAAGCRGRLDASLAGVAKQGPHAAATGAAWRIQHVKQGPTGGCEPGNGPGARRWRDLRHEFLRAEIDGGIRDQESGIRDQESGIRNQVMGCRRPRASLTPDP